MKVFFAFLFTAVLMAALSISTAAQAAQPYDVVEIEKFTISEGVELDDADLTELMAFMIVHFNDSRRFNQVFLSTDTASQTAPARRAKVTGVVTKYNKGNRAARYLIGFGAGRTKLVAQVKVTDLESGQVLFEQKVDGHVYGGLFGGETDAAKSNLASEIIKTMTRKGYANKERIKKKS